MKDYLILYVFTLCFFFSNAEFNVRVIIVLTSKVASNGILILETIGLNEYLKKEDYRYINHFPLRVQEINDKSLTYLTCFLYQFEDQYRTRIGCHTKGLTPGKYQLYPYTTSISLVTKNSSFLIQISIVETDRAFEVTTGNELYFYDYEKKEEDFEYSGHIKDIEFSLFEPVSGQTTIYFGNIPIACNAVISKLTCKLYSNKFPSNKKIQTYDVFIKDSLGNLKKNYFVRPVQITLNYL